VLEAADCVIRSDDFPSVNKDYLIILCSKVYMTIHVYVKITESTYLRCAGDFTHDTFDLIHLETGEELWSDTDQVYTLKRINDGDEFMVYTAVPDK
jgi:hypothetical protein